ncbi:MAG TPA: substrate-binding domain-containing protein [Vicinamibacterales bacterium]|jgi:tungstate transport system substrate-binding protein
MTRIRLSCLVLTSLVAALVGGAVAGHAAPAPDVLRLATTTSTADSGLLQAILPTFEKICGCRVDVIAVGTGQALEIGRRGDADVVLVHGRKAEEQFVAERHARDRHDVMYNDFVIVGPVDDPAKIGTLAQAREALTAIARAQAPFVSRGDKSGTHTAELGVWAGAKISPSGPWYRSLGQGMGETLMVAREQKAYTLTDRGTWLSMRDKLQGLRVLVGGRTLAENRDASLRNPYGVMAVSPDTHPGVQFALATQFVDWLLSAETQRAIGEFGVKRFGQPLFYPDSDETKTTRDVTVKVGARSRTFPLAELRTMPKATLANYDVTGVKIGPIAPRTWTGVALKDLLLAADSGVADTRHANDRIVVTSSDGWTATIWWAELFASVPRGAALYNVKGCNECHGVEGEGSAPAGKRPAPSLAGRTWPVERMVTILRTGREAHGGLNGYTDAQLSRVDVEALVGWLSKPSRSAKGDGYKAPVGREVVLLAYERDGRLMGGREGLLQLVVGPDQFAGRYSHWVRTIEVVPPGR